MHLPNYGVFDEVRYFQAGDQPALVEVDGVLVGLTICEDVWQPGPPASLEALAGAQLVVNVSASPYEHGKPERRERMIVQRARDYVAAMAFCALVGRPGRARLRRPTRSCATTADGSSPGARLRRGLLSSTSTGAPRAARGCATPAARGGRQEPARRALPARRVPPRDAPPRASAHRSAPFLEPDAGSTPRSSSACATTSRRKASPQIVLGLSGGIDSTLVVMLGSTPSGRRGVNDCVMPSRYLERGTQSDDAKHRRGARVNFRELPIAAPMERLRRGAGRGVRRPRPGHHRGEPPGAHPRQHPHGAVEQVRLARADDRQQVRAERRATRRSTATRRAGSP
jgi:NAD+ synthase (glutamine-hydrolysing)